MLWTVPCFFLIGLQFMDCVSAGNQCKEEKSVNGMALKGFVFKKFSGTALHECDISCEREITCQSYNYHAGEKLCELNNRAKEARPENFHSNPAWFYKKRFVDRDCPRDWVFHGNSCYRVINTPRNWTDARTICQNLGADLAIIRSQDENDFILDLLTKQETVRNAWIGLYRKADTKFYWVNESPLEGEYSSWAPGEPSNVKAKCVAIYASKKTRKVE